MLTPQGRLLERVEEFGTVELGRSLGADWSGGPGDEPFTYRWTRSISSGEAGLTVKFTFRPANRTGPLAYVEGTVSLKYDELNLASSVVHPEKLRKRLVDRATMIARVQSLAPRGARPVSFDLADVAEVDDWLASFGSYVERAVAPFVRDYETLGAFLAGIDEDDPRLVMLQDAFVMLAAYYLVQGDAAKARRIVAERVSKPDVRLVMGDDQISTA